MARLLLFLIAFAPLLLHAQLSEEELNKVDSLKAVTASNEHDSIRVSAYMAWDDLIYMFDLETDLMINQKVAEICERNLKKKLDSKEKHFFKTYLARVENNLGYYFDEIAEYDTGLVHYQKSLELRIELDDAIGRSAAINNMGIIYKRLGAYDEAIKLYTQSMKLDQQADDPKGEAATLMNIGVVYIAQGDSEKGLDYIDQSMEMYRELDNAEGIASCLINAGTVQLNNHQEADARASFTEALEIFKELGYSWGIIACYNNLALLSIRAKNYDEAIATCNKALELGFEADNKKGIVAAYQIMADSYLGKNQPSLAKKYGALGYELANSTGDLEQIRMTSRSLYKAHKELGDYRMALEMHENFISARDSLLSEKNQKELFRQQYKLEYETKAAADSVRNLADQQIKDSEIARQDAELAAHANEQIILYGGLGLVLIFALVMYNRFKITRKQKGEIEEAHHELGEKNQEIVDSIAYAKRIQTAILPPIKSFQGELPNSFVLYKPKDVVAGDFYWMEKAASKILIAAADCTGHGVPGAMVSVICNSGLNRSVREYSLNTPGLILDRTREIVIKEFEKSEEEVKDGMDIALCALEGNQLEFAGAHNSLWIIRKGAGEVEPLKADKQPIGKYAEERPFTTHKTILHQGDTIYLYTDGFADQFGGEKGKKFKTANFKRLLLSIQDKEMDEQMELVDEAFENWRGNHEQVDDVCVIGIRM